MKKQGLKNFIRNIASLVVLGCLFMTSEAQGLSTLSVDSANYIAISSVYLNLKMSGGMFECSGNTMTEDNYTAGVTVNLQRYDGGWETIETWSDTGEQIAEVDKYYTPLKGYKYRLYSVHKAYNGNGSCIESVTKYSDTYDYGSK